MRPAASVSAVSVPWLTGRVCLSSGDETGRVTVRDLMGADPGRSEKVHSRRVNGLAYSTHRYGHVAASVLALA